MYLPTRPDGQVPTVRGTAVLVQFSIGTLPAGCRRWILENVSVSWTYCNDAGADSTCYLPKGDIMAQGDFSSHALDWRKSSHSLTVGECVEVAAAGQRVKIRNSILSKEIVLSCSPMSWQKFVEAIKQGHI